MIRRTTWFLLAIFVVLLGVLLYLQRNPLEKEVEATPTPEMILLSLDREQITRLEIKDTQGNQITFVKNADGSWGLADPPATLGSDSAVQSILSRLEGLSAVSVLSGQVQDSVLGLDQPRYEVTVSTSDGNKQTIYIGVQTPTGSGYYIQVGDGPVYVISQFSVDTLLTPLTDPASVTTATAESIPGETPQDMPAETPSSTP